MKDSQRISTIQDFLKFAYRELNIKQSPRIRLVQDNKIPKQHRSLGGYSPPEKELWIYIKNRNLADILRTLAHELVHHSQHEKGGIKHSDGSTGSEVENEANSLAGVLLRKYGMMNPLIYESISMSALTEDLQKYELYCDMDGVLCDFDAQFDHYFGESPIKYYKERGKVPFDNAINEAGIEFWSEMPWTEGGKALWEKIARYGVKILSSPSDYEHAKQGKLLWVEKHLSPKPDRVIFEQTGQKHNILQGKSEVEIEHSILIDDFDRNLNPWKDLGGKVVKYTTSTHASHTLDKLK